VTQPAARCLWPGVVELVEEAAGTGVTGMVVGGTVVGGTVVGGTVVGGSVVVGGCFRAGGDVVVVTGGAVVVVEVGW
jgi:hypothetical protein